MVCSSAPHKKCKGKSKSKKSYRIRDLENHESPNKEVNLSYASKVCLVLKKNGWSIMQSNTLHSKYTY